MKPSDWITDAINDAIRRISEIAHDANANAELEAMRAAIIEHCPFKPDVYMPVPRCDSCRHWDALDESQGRCLRMCEKGSPIWPVYDDIITNRDFGCVAWETKMTLIDYNDWITKAMAEIEAEHGEVPTLENIELIVRKHCPKDNPLLQCIDCKNTESPAGAMARYFNQGRCLHCGGWFKVVRA